MKGFWLWVFVFAIGYMVGVSWPQVGAGLIAKAKGA
jgi:hypothetical protein